MKTIVIVLALLVAVGRMFITPRLAPTTPFTAELSYEAFAHIVWGMLFGIWWTCQRHSIQDTWRPECSTRHFCGWFAVWLALWELGWCLVQKYL